MPIDLASAAAFLDALAGVPNSPFTFQTFDDTPAERKSLVRILHAPLLALAGTLAAINERGGGVYATINETDLRGRQARNIVKVRALFVDMDGAPLEALTKTRLLPNILVQSSPGRFHAYWFVRDFPLDRFFACQKRLIALTGSDPAICDLPRVMRLPGFYHNKHTPFLTECEIIHHARYDDPPR